MEMDEFLVQCTYIRDNGERCKNETRHHPHCHVHENQDRPLVKNLLDASLMVPDNMMLQYLGIDDLINIYHSDKSMETNLFLLDEIQKRVKAIDYKEFVKLDPFLKNLVSKIYIHGLDFKKLTDDEVTQIKYRKDIYSELVGRRDIEIINNYSDRSIIYYQLSRFDSVFRFNNLSNIKKSVVKYVEYRWDDQERDNYESFNDFIKYKRFIKEKTYDGKEEEDIIERKLKIKYLSELGDLRLPDYLYGIEFDDYFNGDINNLPAGLHTLVFGNKFNQNVNNLPPGLHTLKFGDNFGWGVDNLPSGLHTLTLGCNFNWRIDKLPSGLHTLTLGKNFNQTISHLPEKLQVLYVSARSYRKSLDHLSKNIKIIRY